MPRNADEGFADAILVGPRRLADQHHLGSRIAIGEDQIGRVLAQRMDAVERLQGRAQILKGRSGPRRLAGRVGEKLFRWVAALGGGDGSRCWRQTSCGLGGNEAFRLGGGCRLLRHAMRRAFLGEAILRIGQNGRIGSGLYIKGEQLQRPGTVHWGMVQRSVGIRREHVGKGAIGGHGPRLASGAVDGPESRLPKVMLG